MEKNVWEITASEYDTYVTRTKNKALKEYLQIEEKLLDSLLLDLVPNEKKISLIEIGSGTARTLFSYLTKRPILRKLTYIIGIDNAGAMYERSKSKFSDYKNTGWISRKDQEKFVFLWMNAEEMSRFFQNGRINLREMKIAYGGNSYIKNLKPRRYNSSFKLVVNLLNTLGVMEEETRKKVLRSMISAAGPRGKIVVSVFDAECFDKIAPDVYTSIKRITGKFGPKAFNHQKKEFRSGNYYSHWFSYGEIIEKIESAGLKIENVIPIEAALKGFFIVGET